MRKTAVLTAAFILNLAFPLPADEGFEIELRNTRLAIINYNVLQIDHGFPNFPGPMAVMGGELDPGQRYVSPCSRNFGKYIVQWYSKDEKDSNTFEFTVYAPTKKIVIYYNKVVYQ